MADEDNIDVINDSHYFANYLWFSVSSGQSSETNLCLMQMVDEKIEKDGISSI
jgi:hypothetical protein